ncbi:aminotransferase class IV [Kineococcus terrestris]|uniref:aminotransferase class IV n=1 Tax=Kineococcus terrestris TaxID=2044856 RepID=UPI0034DB78C0
MSSPAPDPRTLLLRDGRVHEVEPGAAVVGADDGGLTRGDGCFETLRVLGGDPPRALGLDAHLERLARSAAALDLTSPTADVWRAAARAAAREVPAGAEAALRLTLTRGTAAAGPTALLTLRPVGAEVLAARERGVRLVALDRGTALDTHAAAPWLLGGVKSLSYAVHTAALREAARRGADDAVFTTPAGEVLEAPTATVVVLAAGTLRTPAAGASGILAGTTQRAVFAGAAREGVPTAEGPLALAELAGADGAWLVSSVRGAVEVVALDGAPVRRAPGWTARLRAWAEEPDAAGADIDAAP